MSETGVSVFRIPKTNKKDKDDDNDEKDDEKKYTKLLLHFPKPLKIWIGQDVSKETFFEGNSILLQISSQTYVFIGCEIYEFELAEPDEKVKSYHSPVGNSDVPYPYLVTNKNVYFMIENVYAPRSQFDDEDLYFNEPYEVHYNREGKDEDYITYKIKHRKVLIKRIW